MRWSRPIECETSRQALLVRPGVIMPAMARQKLDQLHAEASEDARMTLGEHLDELRWCVARALIALVLAVIPCFWLAKYVLHVLARPLVLAMGEHNQPPSFLATGPLETFAVYIKVALFCAVVLAGPYMLYQFWSFIGKGLYPNERKWVMKLAPLSGVLFVGGVVFMYLFVLLLSLNFLVGFSTWLSLPTPEPTTLEKLLLGTGKDGAIDNPVAPALLPPVPIYGADPKAPETGAIWFNASQRRLKLQSEDTRYAVTLERDRGRPLVTTHFRINEYLGFIMTLTIGFGLAFQMPLVVVFLVRAGILPLAMLRAYRKVAIMIIAVLAAVLSPPDPLSYVVLIVPMYLLYEAGVFWASRGGRPTRAP